MKKRLKRITSLLLAAMIAATSAAYAPPASGSEGFMPSVALEAPENMATPSEAVKATPSEADNAIPSDAVPNEEISTPSQAEKSFVQVEPEEEEIPEYYSRVSKAGKKFWKFEDRNGSVQYRGYGYIQGEAEFPLWYCLTAEGDLDIEDTSLYPSGVDLNDEYRTLAPYLFKSVEPTDESWKGLESLISTEGSLDTQNKEELRGFKNWDQTEYSIYHLTAKEPAEEPEEPVEEIEDLGYFFYGSIPNAENLGTCWWYADENGKVTSVVRINRFMALAAALPSTYDLTFSSMSVYFDGTIDRVRVNDYTDKPKASDTDDTLFTLWTPSWSGYTFLGWDTVDIYHGDWTSWGNTVLKEPQNHPYYMYGGTFYRPDSKITRRTGDILGQLFGAWKPNGTYSLQLLSTPYGECESYYGTAASKLHYLIIKNPGVTIDLTDTTKYSNPTKDGYTFCGWYSGPNATGTQYTSISLTSDTVLYAGFTPNSNTVRFFDADGNLLNEQIVPSGNSAVAPTPPTIDGKVFAGWNKDFSNVISDMNIKAQYTDAATITVRGNGGTVYGQEIYTTTVPIGSLWSSLSSSLQSNAIREGYTASGLWYEKEDGTTGSFSTTYINNDIDVFVNWRANVYSITFNGNGGKTGTDTTKSVSISYGNPVLSKAPVFTKQYYKFKGFYTSSYLGNLIMDDTLVTGAATYYAQWDAFNTDIIYHDCIPESDWTATIQVWSGTTGLLTNPSHDERIGYTGPSWYTQPNKGGSPLYTYGDSLRAQLDGHETLDVYAYWTPRTYNLNCFKNTATDSTSYTRITYNFDMEDSDLPAWDAESGKVFVGYSTAKTGGTLYKKISDLPFTNTTTVISLYAQYVNASNTVTFKDWDGTVLDTQEVAIGTDATPPQVPERSGYTFTGWDTPYTNIQEPTIITAQYSRNTYTLTLDGNGGYLNGAATRTQEFSYGESIDQALADGASVASRKYFTFDGWYTEADGGNKYTGTTMPETDMTVYARWVRSSSEVVFNDFDGTFLKQQEVAIEGDATPPQVTERSGYTFTGWDTPYTNIQDHVTITAQYTVNRYQLTLDGNGGSLSGNSSRKLTLEYGESIDQALTDAAAEANQEYYTFDGWYTEAAGGSKYATNGNLMPASDLTVYAHWMRSSSEVIYKDYDGTILKWQEVAIGGNATPPQVPERSGYTFTGWDKSSTNIQDHVTITAQYTVNSYRLTLDGNGGSFSGDFTRELTLEYGQSIDQALTDTAAEANQKYFTFDGWYTEAAGGSKYATNGNLMPASDLMVYAHWMRSSSEVVYKDFDGTILKRQEVAIGGDATPPQVPERSGYTFTGWDTPSTNIQDHVTITAQYTINGYLLTLDGNGGTMNGSATKEQVLSFAESFDQALINGRDLVIRPGYHFDGWYNSPTGGSSYSYSGNQMPAADVTVYAHWTANSYKVTFDPEHERWSGGTTEEDHTFDTELGTLPSPEIYGWKFTGWRTGPDGTGTMVTEHSMVEPKDVTYYGSWEPETYQIHFVSKAAQPSGESVQTFTVSQNYDSPLGTLPVPEESGYTFTGWYDDNNEKISSQTIFCPDSGAEGYTYHAGWVANTYKIHFTYEDLDGKPVIIEMDGTYFTQIGTLPTPEKPGYTFIGWFKDNGEEVTSGSWVEAGDTVYKARWKANQYTIHFERNLPDSVITENPKDQTVTYGLPIGELPVLHETGYLFLGWYTEPTGGIRIRETTPAALGDQTYYAHWIKGWIDHGNGTHSRPGVDGIWETEDDELWWNGPDGIPGTDDDQIIYIGGSGGTTIHYIDNGDRTHIRPGAGGSWNGGDTEHWWNGSDGIPGTDDDRIIIIGGTGSNPIHYIDNGDGTHTRPGAGGSWNDGDTEHWWNGSDGIPGTDDDKIIIIGGTGTDGNPISYIDNGDGTHTRPGAGGNWNDEDTEHWWNGPDGVPGTDDDKEIHTGGTGGDGSPIQYIDNGDGTHTRPGADGTWDTEDDEIWLNGPDGAPGTPDDSKKDNGGNSGEPTEPIEPNKPDPTEPNKPDPTEPTKPEPGKAVSNKEEDETVIISPVLSVIDTTTKPVVPDTGGTFTVNPDNPYDVTYTKPDGTPAHDEWVGDGKDWYHVDEDGKLNYDWYLEGGNTWYKLNKETDDRFGAALIGWFDEPMDDKRYFFDPATTKMLTGWQTIDGKDYYFNEKNDFWTYHGDNHIGWLFIGKGRPYGSMYKNEFTPDGHWVDENGVRVN